MQGWVTDSHIVRCTSGKETWCAPSISDSCGKSFTGSSAWCKSSSVCCKISCSSFGFATGWKLDEIILNLHRVNWLLNKKSNNKRSVKCDFEDHSINPCSHQSVPLTPALSSWLWLGCQRFHHFHSHYSPVIPRSWYNTAWPVFSVNSSVGYLMQGLTADLVSIYPKDDSGTKIQGGKHPKSNDLDLEYPRHRECSPQNPKDLKAWNSSSWQQMNVTPVNKNTRQKFYCCSRKCKPLDLPSHSFATSSVAF